MVVRRLVMLAHRTASSSLGTGNAHQWWGTQAILLLLGQPDDVPCRTNTSFARIQDVDETWRYVYLWILASGIQPERCSLKYDY